MADLAALAWLHQRPRCCCRRCCAPNLTGASYICGRGAAATLQPTEAASATTATARVTLRAPRRRLGVDSAEALARQDSATSTTAAVCSSLAAEPRRSWRQLEKHRRDGVEGGGASWRPEAEPGGQRLRLARRLGVLAHVVRGRSHPPQRLSAAALLSPR